MMRRQKLKRVTIVGVGLLGGSLGLTIKRLHSDIEVIGVDCTRAILNRAEQRGAIDHGMLDLAEGVAKADLIFLATPIKAILELLPTLAECIAKEAIVSDLGSTKEEICRVAQAHLPENFVGGHPMTGSEHQGIDAADPFLFENSVYILTPLRPASRHAGRLASFLRSLSIQVLYLSPLQHDRLVAYVSHLPQLLAVLLTDLIRERSEADGLYRELAAGGFRDMTRIASSPYELWQDILRTNREPIAQALDDLISKLQAMRRAVPSEIDLDLWRESFLRAAAFRASIPSFDLHRE